MPTDDSSDGVPTPQRYWAVLAIALAVTMAVMDTAIANIALPTIAADLHAAPADSIWVVNAYQLAVTISLLPLASLGEIYGYRRVYMVGLAVFTTASLACSASHTLAGLTVARMLQGFGGAGVMSVNSALVRFVYPRALLGRGIGINALVVASSSAIGPTVASGILTVAPWSWLFAVNVPIGLAAFIIGLRALPATPLAARRFDAGAALLSALTFGLLIVGIDGYAHGQSLLAVALELAAAAGLGALLVRREAGRAAPLLPVDLLRIPLFRLSVVTSTCSFAAAGLALVSLPFAFEGTMGWNATQTGLLMTPFPLAVACAAPLAGRLADRYSAGVLGGIGLAVFASGLLLMAMVAQGTPGPDIAWRMGLCGAGFGIFQSPNNRAILSSAPLARTGGASGMLGTARLLGQTLGAAFVALIFSLHAGSRQALLLAAGLAAGGMLASLLRLKQEPVAPAR